MKNKNLIFISFFSIYLFFPGFSQNWEWKWSDQNTQKDASAWSYIMDIDFQNSIYTGTQYGDSIFFGDTLFTQENYYDWANWAIAKYDNEGHFQTAFNITSMPNKMIIEVDMVTDNFLNMYIACEFQQIAYLLDTTIYHGSPNAPDMPDLFLAKITPSFDVEWIRLISSTSQDACKGLAISSDNYLYMATSHSGFAGNTDTVVYMGQDTVIFETALYSLLKIDLNGNLVWRNELNSNAPSIVIREINIDISNNIIMNGYLRDDLYYADDTIFHPHPGEYFARPFIIKTDSYGELISGIIHDWSIVLADTDIDDFGNFFFAGFVWDTAYFGSDTLIQHEDSTVNILAKLDAGFEPVWYETTQAKSEYGSFYFYIDSYQDTLFFAGRCRSTFTMFDTVFNPGSYYEAFIGQVTPNGELDKFTFSESLWGFRPFGLELDNCNNLLVSGQFKGYAYIGPDTIESHTMGVWDGIITQITRYDPFNFSLGPDTTVCDSVTLFGPEGYQYYYWNNNLTGQNWLNISESGEYVFSCANDDGCWINDTINITVQPGFTINLGQDTIISQLDTLYLSVPDFYDSYLWSTGSTENSIEIPGSTYGAGNWNIWVEVTQGVCTKNDTIQITITSAVPELQKIGILVYPNPVEDVLYILSEEKLTMVELIDLKGETIIMEENQTYLKNPLKIDLINVPSGIYIIRVYFNDLVGNGKIVKL